MKNLSILVLIALWVPMIGAADVVIPIESVENHVNVRFAADAKSEIVGHLQQGETMPYVNSVPGWHQVALQGGGTGFIHEDWCLVVTEAAAYAKPAPEPVADEDAARPPGAVAEAEPVEEAEVAAEEAVEDAEAVAEETAAEPESAPEPEAVADVELAEAAPVEEAVAEAEPEEAVVADAEEPAAEEVAAATEPAEETVADAEEAMNVVTAVVPVVAAKGDLGPPGPTGPPGPPGPSGASTIEGSVDFLMKFTAPTIGASSQVYDDGHNIGIGTTEPKQRLEVNGNIQIHERNSNVAALMLTQADGDTGYIMHNRANTLTIGAGSVDRITIDGDGYVGFGTSRPTHPFEMASGAFVSAGGVWTNSSSITKKENVTELTVEEAIKALVELEPVHFNYINDDGEDYIGFIAEDVPEVVATSDRTGLSTMDIVAVLTKVVQEQQARIEALEKKLEQKR